MAKDNVGIKIVALLVAGKEAAAMKINERQTKFQQRAILAGMPTSHYAHERSADVVAAGALDGSGHTLFIKGVAKKTATTKAGILDYYFAMRDDSFGGRTNAEYVVHNENCVNGTKRIESLTAKGIKNKGRITAATSRKNPANSNAATPKSAKQQPTKKAPKRKLAPVKTTKISDADLQRVNERSAKRNATAK